jgi:hypothetical protein
VASPPLTVHASERVPVSSITRLSALSTAPPSLTCPKMPVLTARRAPSCRSYPQPASSNQIATAINGTTILGRSKNRTGLVIGRDSWDVDRRHSGAMILPMQSSGAPAR